MNKDFWESIGTVLYIPTSNPREIKMIIFINFIQQLSNKK